MIKSRGTLRPGLGGTVLWSTASRGTHQSTLHLKEHNDSTRHILKGNIQGTSEKTGGLSAVSHSGTPGMPHLSTRAHNLLPIGVWSQGRETDLSGTGRSAGTPEMTGCQV